MFSRSQPQSKVVWVAFNSRWILYRKWVASTPTTSIYNLWDSFYLSPKLFYLQGHIEVICGDCSISKNKCLIIVTLGFVRFGKKSYSSILAYNFNPWLDHWILMNYLYLILTDCSAVCNQGSHPAFTVNWPAIKEFRALCGRFSSHPLCNTDLCWGT